MRKINRKSDPQPKTEPLPNLCLAIPRQHIIVKRLTSERHSEITEKGKGEMAF